MAGAVPGTGRDRGGWARLAPLPRHGAAGRCSYHAVDRSGHDQGAARQQDRAAAHHGTCVDVKWTSPGPSIGYGFPIPSGQVDAATLAGHINHTGGLRFVNLANGKQLSLTRFRIVIDAHPHLTAIVNGDPKVRVSILRLDLSKATVTKPLPYVRVGNVGAYLNSTAAGALNNALGVSFFAPGIKLGTAYVNAHVAG